MDNLLCDESWLSDPPTPEPLPNFHRNVHNEDVAEMSQAMDAETVEEAISMDLKKELRSSKYGEDFVKFILSNKLSDVRFHVVQWFIQTRYRFNLSFETLFSAASCFDRFVYATCCNEWSNWMVELVAVTSLSIASKFNEVASPSLQELQLYGLNHMFHLNTVLEMELIVLKATEWHVNPVTSYSFSQILMSKMGLIGDKMMMNTITDRLVDDLCDLEMLQYPQSVVAAAALWNVLEEKGAGDDSLGRIMNLFGQGYKDNIAKCIQVQKSGNMDHRSARIKALQVKSHARGEMMNVGYHHVGDLSAIFPILRSDKKKREREQLEDNIRPAKRMTVVMSK